MAFDKKAPDWKAEGIEPPLSKREIGWEVEDKPPAAWLNWYMNSTSESIQELQTKAAGKTYVDEQISEAIEGIEIDVPDASLTQKGIAMLEDSTASTSIVKAATPNSVKVVNDSLVAHKADYIKHSGYAVATGLANTYIATLSPALAAYVEGVSLRLKINVQNTGTSTINVSGLGTKAILKGNGNALASGNLKVGSVYTLVFNGTSFILQGEGGDYGTAVAADVLSGKSVGTDAGIVNGTMPNRSGAYQGAIPHAASPTVGIVDVLPFKGYWDGATYAGISDPDFIAANIRNDQNMFGLQGTMPVVKADILATSTAGTSPGNVYARGPAAYYPTGPVLRCEDPDFIPANIREGMNLFGVVGTSIEGKRCIQGVIASDADSNIKVPLGGWLAKRIFVWPVSGIRGSWAAGQLADGDDQGWMLQVRNDAIISRTGGFQNQNNTYYPGMVVLLSNTLIPSGSLWNFLILDN